ncbi:MAG: hypothetical protein J6B34_01740 [Clostridia bacterium]|nr:hypothetical protein [Clostridia bacterium]
MKIKVNNKTLERVTDLSDLLLYSDYRDSLYFMLNNKLMLEFQPVAVIPLNDTDVYALMHPLSDIGVGDDEAIVFSLVEDDDVTLKLETKQETIEAVFKKYYELMEEES